MPKNSNDKFNVDSLLDSLFPSDTLVDLFEARIKELDILPTNALEILNIEYRALQGILNGTSKRVDLTNFIKLASFLKLPKEYILELYFKVLEKNNPETIALSKDKINFINENFDLATLFRAGFITDITDYLQIEKKINSHFGFKSIFEYALPSKKVAFSSGVRKSKDLNRGFWINSAIDAFEEIANPYDYDRDALLEYFPEIRWHSTNLEKGLIKVIGDLFKLGISVLYQSTLPALHLKGATLEVNGKPCIVLTDYVGFYLTLWHTLCHELSHVLFDFEDIKVASYHISDNDLDLAVSEKEKQADDFARGYLFSKEKSMTVKPHINNKKFINEFAAKNNVHPSFIYTYHAFDNSKDDTKAWAKAKSNNPSLDSFINKIENPWANLKSSSIHVKHLKETKIYQ